MFEVSQEWKAAYPGAFAGVLVMRHVANPENHPELDKRKEDLENALRSRFSNQSKSVLESLPAIQAYDAYYKRFKKTYHVLLQFESIVFKSKSIPRVAALVEAMFMAELQDLLLTAGHDLEAIQSQVTTDVAKGTEHYIMLNGKEQELKAGDMIMSDAQGVISSVIYGPGQRTRITPNTQRVFFATYAPPGIEESTVYSHLQTIQSNVLLVSPNAETEILKVYGTI